MAQQRGEIGRRLLPHLVDEIAADEPDRVLYEFPASTDLNQPWVKVTARLFANAINRAAQWLEDELGRGVTSSRIGYSGPQDLRYFIFVVAAVKAGHVVLYTSPRNSIEGEVAVIRAAGCHTWLLPSRGSNIRRVLEHVELKLVDTPDLNFFLDPTPAPHYEYTKTWDTGKRDLVWVLHTSGSTGHPKPIFRYLDSLASVDANNLLPKVQGRSVNLHEFWHSRAYVTFPFFHAAGMNNGLLWPLCHGATTIFGPELPVNLNLMKSVIRHAKPDTVFTAPSLIEEVSKDAEFLALLESVKAIGWGGGPVSREAGTRIWKHTKLRLSMGMTEVGWLPCVETDLEDWYYVHVHPDAGYQFQDRGGGLYELVAVRNPELERWQPIFSTFPDLQEYPFKDLFSRHPTKPDLFLYEGRIDNVIVLSNGEKVQPNGMELTIGSHPLVRTAVVAGQGRFQTSVLIEVQPDVYPYDEADRQKLIDLIWPAIEAANSKAPSQARLYRDFVVFTSPDRPLPKATKGTVQRVPALQLYAEELERVYSQDISSVGGSAVLPLDLESAETLQGSLRALVLPLVGLSTIDNEADFFAVAGMDSLQVLTLRKQILRALHQHRPDDVPDISTALIYRNPSVVLLAQALWKLLRTHTNGHVPVNGSSDVSDTAKILRAKYTSKWSRVINGQAKATTRLGSEGNIIILTGSTGRLGSYILDELMQSTPVREIWCVNRSPTARQRQTELNTKRGLDVDFEGHNARFLQADLAKERLGLDIGDYSYLLQNATHVIHTQRQVDFNLAVGSFEPHIRGVRNLVDFAAEASARPRIFFTSSVSVGTNFPSARGLVSEEPIRDLAIAGPGYGESKLIAETVLLEAAENTGVHVTICRVGQIAGPVRQGHEGGEWNRKEWFPSIIDASVYLSKVPQTLGKNECIDWIPVDHLSTVILELAEISSINKATDETPRIFHAVNPKRVKWSEALLHTVRKRIQAQSNKRAIEVVPLENWIEALKAAAQAADEKDENCLVAGEDCRLHRDGRIRARQDQDASSLEFHTQEDDSDLDYGRDRGRGHIQNRHDRDSESRTGHLSSDTSQSAMSLRIMSPVPRAANAPVERFEAYVEDNLGSLAPSFRPNGGGGSRSTQAHLAHLQYLSPSSPVQQVDVDMTARATLDWEQQMERLDSADMDYLKAKGAFDLPPRHVQQELIDAYFFEVHPTAPVINRREFLSEFQEGRTQRRLLLFAIFTSGARACRNPALLDDQGTNHTSARRFYKATKALLDTGYEGNRLARVQALLLITWWWDKKDDGGRNMRSCAVDAINTAQSIGMHRWDQYPRSDPVLLGLWKRIWWSCVNRDVGVAVAHGLPTMTTLSEFDDFNEGAPTPHSPGTKRYGYSETEIMFMIEQTKIAEALHHIHDTYFVKQRLQQSTTGSIMAREEQIARGSMLPGQKSRSLENPDDYQDDGLTLCRIWLRRVPKAVQYNIDDVQGHSFWPAFLHLLYFTNIMLRFREVSVSRPTNSRGIAERQYCRARGIAAATMISKIIRNMRAHGHVLRCTGQLTNSLFNCLIFFLIEGRSPNSKSEHQWHELFSGYQTSSEHTQSYVRQLLETDFYYAGSNLGAQNLDDLSSNAWMESSSEDPWSGLTQPLVGGLPDTLDVDAW
ncbi:hypothetical protein QQX98_005065 [Neonectria punicea]|uniref:Carrier domain-containing protein n=1 Tax=Neonectria punicea TaxID=979145 RepID=A0ABR1H6B8_9HYPO